MAPLASEPRQLLVVLNLAKRKALYTLVVEITAWMRSQLELRQPSDADAEAEAGVAPLFVSPALAPDEDGRPVDVSVLQRKTPPSPELVRLRNAALAHFDAWRRDVLGKLKEVLSPPDDAGIVEERRKRTERIARERVEIPSSGENLMDLSDWGPGVDAVAEAKATRARDVARLQSDFHAIPTRLLTIPQDDREETLSCLLLLLLSAGSYSADSRVLAVYLASAFEIPLSRLNTEETEIACSLVETSAEAARKQASPSMSADAEAEKRKQQNQTSRYWKVGLASVAGAAIIGVTGGLAAPMVAGAIGGLMGSVGLGGVASFLGLFWMNGALVGTLFGAYGARMTGEAVDQYAREVEDFRFLPLKDQLRSGSPKSKDEARRLRVTIGVNGWLDSEHDIKAPWRSLGDDTEVFALRYEVKSLMGLGQSLKDLVSSAAWNWVKVEILKRTVLVTLWAALWPVYLLSMASSIDNPFSLAKNRSEKAGEILADALINKVQGERPVTLVGYSLGARVIYSCLRSLAQRRAFGLVDTVVLIGAPIPSNRNHWQMMRSVVSGKVFNVCSENDYLLAFLYRATSIQLGVAGLQSIKDIEGVENIDLSEEVDGHLRYPDIIDKILYRCGFQVVEGAAGPIEKDEGGIKMEDSTAAGATGTLIEFDALAITEPPRPTPEPAAPPLAHSPKLATQPTSPDPERKQRTAVTRWAPSNISASQSPLGTEVPPDPLSQLPSTVNLHAAGAIDTAQRYFRPVYPKDHAWCRPVPACL
ncbi:hypothetical protein B0T26DRAFT_670631 [Lasiosphaeria miniovina]|uniref:Transmembrane and coiled-coil domain-containing protein 4 n=1 Tax=Lasiosphaeria miniovina TaxID=1954250 RepID=A0AA40EGB9_9PEZI|nr:uncharacterized protein B0T26DRAFT_670631 [Lasiosphaeria miniovina]KAK0734313.1 hypothetical protein B0T26DRAFT_670631 [Lasiosphaeria miniovina]